MSDNGAIVSVNEFMAAYEKALLYGWYMDVDIPFWAEDGLTQEEAIEQDLYDAYNDFNVIIGDDDMSVHEFASRITLETCREYAEKGGWWDEYHLRELGKCYNSPPHWVSGKDRDKCIEKMLKEKVPILVKYGYLYYDKKE